MSIDYPNMTMTLQLQFLMALNMASFIYLGKCEPSTTRMDRRLELFNEFMIGATLISMLASTDAVASPNTQFIYTWITIGIIEIQILANCLLVIITQVKSIILVAKKYYNTTDYAK